MWAARNWQLHRDNAPAHSVHLIQAYLAKNNTPLFDTLPTLQTWHLVTSGCSLKCIEWREEIMKSDGKALQHSNYGIPEMLPGVAAPLGEMCELPRGVL